MSDKTRPAAWALEAAEEIMRAFGLLQPRDVYDFREIAEIIERHAADRWIPVTPQTLPEEGCDCLIVESWHWEVLKASFQKGEWFEGGRQVFPTHWQPLPDTPKEATL